MDSGNAARFVALVIAKPLTPPDCTMKGLEYMPLMVDRLRGSRAWLSCKRRPELAFYLLNLWSACWGAMPAGSLEDDDDVLADAAMCPPQLWPSVRADVLRGFLRCSADGRLYHPVVSELALRTWQGRLAYREQTAKARAAKAAKRERTVVAQAALDLPLPGGVEAKPLETHEDALQQTFKSEVRSEKVKGEAPFKTPQPKTRGVRLDENWNPGQQGYSFAIALNLDANETLAAFTDHYRAAPGIRGSSLDWDGTWREWCRGAARIAQRSAGSAGNRHTRPAWHLESAMRDYNELMATQEERFAEAAAREARIKSWVHPADRDRMKREAAERAAA